MSRGPVIGALLMALAGAFVAARMEVVTDITHFLPFEADRDRAGLMRRIADSALSRTMVLLVEAPDTARAVAGSRALEAALRADPDVSAALAFIEGGPPEGVEEALWTLYHPRRLSFVAADAEAAAARTTDAGLKAAAAEIKRRLGLPMAPLVSRVAPADPFLALTDLFDRLQHRQASGVGLADGRFVAVDRRRAVLFLATHASAFDGAAQARFLAGLDRIFAAVNADGALTLRMSGVNRFAVRAEQAIKADITRVSTLSVLGLLLLFAGLFRSARLIGLGGLPIGAGMLAGCAVSLALFGRIHGLTLAFGASLIGVCVDYMVHLYSHHALAPGADAEGTARSIAPGLFLGAATTVIGFVGLAFSAFPGLREVAVFASVGVAAALAATRWMLPPLMPGTLRPAPALRRLADGLARGLERARGHRGALLWIPAAALLLVGAGWPAVDWEDDVRALSRLDPALLAEDEAVRAQVARFEQQRFVVALGDTEEAALQVNDRVAAALAAAEADDALGGFQNVHGLLPSAARQVAVRDAVRGSPQLWTRLEAALTEAGFRPSGFVPFEETLAAEPAPALTWRDLAGSPLASMVRSFRVDLDGRVGFLSFLRDVRDPDALAGRIDGIPGAVFLDQGALMTAAYQAYRRRAVELVLLGLLAVVALVALRHRALRPTVAACAPALLAAAVTVVTLGLLGVPLNLVALTALLMVLSMGVDYGVFLVESARHHPQALGATLVSLVVACASTVLGFGLLALSDHPALRAIGLTAGIGTLASLVLAPATLALVGARPATSERTS